MSRKIALSVALATQFSLTAMAASAPASAQDATPPAYFFQEWTVSDNCAEANSTVTAQVQAGLQFKISSDSLDSSGSYVFEAEDNAQTQWAANWNGLELSYRPGTPMASVPADFECIPGATSSSPLLAMSGYAQATEPYYEQEHWYGLATINGQAEHVLIFPRNTTGASSAIIVLESVNSPQTVQLDDNGVIHSQN
jgi:hypothetical protein